MILEMMLYKTIMTIIFMMLLIGTTQEIKLLFLKSALYKEAHRDTGHEVRNKTNGFIYKIARFGSIIAVYLYAYKTYYMVVGISGFWLLGSYLAFNLFARFLFNNKRTSADIL